MHPGAYILARPLTTGEQEADATDEPEDAPRSLHARFASFSSAQGLRPQSGRMPMPPISPRMPPEPPIYELANVIILIFIDQDGFETETLRPKAFKHRGGGQGARGHAPTVHRRQHQLEALGR